MRTSPAFLGSFLGFMMILAARACASIARGAVAGTPAARDRARGGKTCLHTVFRKTTSGSSGGSPAVNGGPLKGLCCDFEISFSVNPALPSAFFTLSAIAAPPASALMSPGLLLVPGTGKRMRTWSGS